MLLFIVGSISLLCSLFWTPIPFWISRKTFDIEKSFLPLIKSQWNSEINLNTWFDAEDFLGRASWCGGFDERATLHKSPYDIPHNT